jgi:nucleoside-diphosphate-sugar epimerase
MILVTGGTGLLGSHLLVELTKSNDKIRAIYRSENRIQSVEKLFRYYFGDSYRPHWEKIEWVLGDILDIESLKVVFKDIKIVYHSAGFVSFDSSDFRKCIKINREGTANIVNLCLNFQVKKLGYVSSTAAVGGIEGKMITEADKWEKTPLTSGYSVSKYLAEKEVWRGMEEGLNAVIINPCVILGPGNWDETSLTIFKNASKGMKFYTTGSNATVDARDVAGCLVKLVNSHISKERFLCIGTNQSFQQLISEIALQAKAKVPSTPIQKKWLILFSRLLSPFYRLFGKKSPLSIDTINSAYKKLEYDNSRIKEITAHSFYSLHETVANALKAGKF